MRLDEWSKNLVAVAKSVCGRENAPCGECIQITSKVVKYWHEALLIKAKAVRQKAEAEDPDLPMVDLSTAFFIASSVLDPATSVELEGWGAA